MKKEILVINYHQIDTGKNTGISRLESIYAVPYSLLKGHIDVLTMNKIPVVTLNDILTKNISSPFSVAITVDDGNSTDYEIMYPLLEQNKIKAAFFLITQKRINWDHINIMIKHGFTIGSHGVTHCDLTNLSNPELLLEFETSKKTIEEKTGQLVNFFAIPFSRYNQKILKLAAAIGYEALLTTEVRLNDIDNDTFLIHRWSIKKTTSSARFEKMLLNRNYLNMKVIVSKLAHNFNRIAGKTISDKLNLLLHG